MIFQPSLGLFIARDSANLVLLGKSLRGPRLIDSVSRPLEPGEGLSRKVRSAFLLLDEFVSKHRVVRATLHVGFETDLAAIRHLEMPLAVKQNLRAAIGYEIENYVPLNADNVFFDFQILAQNKASKTLDLLLVVTRKDNVQRIIEAAQETGQGVDGIEIGATALINAKHSLCPMPPSNDCAFLFVGDSCAEIALIRKGALVYGTGVDRPHGSSEFAGLIGSHLGRIAHSVGLGQSRPSLFAFGPGLSDELMEWLKGEGFEVDKLKGLPDALNSGALVFAYGLAVRPFLKVPATVNLMPPELRRKPSRISQYAMVVLTGLLIVSVLGWWGSGIAQQRRMARKLDIQLAQLQKQVQRVERDKRRYEDLVQRIHALQQVIQAPLTPLDILRELTEIVPDEAWVNELSISGQKVVISGYADVATELIPIIENSPLFHDVSFLSPVSKTRDGKERFRVGLEVG